MHFGIKNAMSFRLYHFIFPNSKCNEFLAERSRRNIKASFWQQTFGRSLKILYRKNFHSFPKWKSLFFSCLLNDKVHNLDQNEKLNGSKFLSEMELLFISKYELRKTNNLNLDFWPHNIKMLLFYCVTFTWFYSTREQ